MKTIKLLVNLITIYYYVMLVALIITVFGVVGFFLDGQNIEPKILGEQVDFSSLDTSKVITLLLVMTILYSLYIRGIYLLKGSVSHLASGNYFSAVIVSKFKKIGKLFIACAFLEFAGKVIMSILIESRINLSFDSSLFLFLIMGLFFVFLSEVFAKGKQLEQENKLTI